MDTNAACIMDTNVDIYLLQDLIRSASPEKSELKRGCSKEVVRERFVFLGNIA